MGTKFGFKIRMGLEGEFVDQDVPACMDVEGFRKSVEPSGCLDNYDFYVAKSQKGSRKKMGDDDIFGPGEYVSIVER